MATPKVVNALNTPYPTTVEVHFDQVMLDDGELTDPGNYLFNRGAFATSVSIIDEKQVRLVVENLFDYTSFSVTVSGDVKSFTGVGVPDAYNSASIDVSRPAVGSFAVAISATNGRMRSGTNSIKVDEDTNSWYIMTESGLDVVDKNSLSNTAFILDGYGFNTIAIS